MLTGLSEEIPIPFLRGGLSSVGDCGRACPCKKCEELAIVTSVEHGSM